MPASITEGIVNFIAIQSAVRIKEPLRIKRVRIRIYLFILADRPRKCVYIKKCYDFVETYHAFGKTSVPEEEGIRMTGFYTL